MLMLPFFDKILFYTDREVESFLKLRIFLPLKFRVRALNNGIDQSLININRIDYRPSLRGPSILFIGRLTAKADFQLLIKALSFFEDSEVITVHVVGSSSFPSNIKTTLQPNHVNIRFHGEIYDEKLIADIANQCRLFVYPGMVGLSLIHAMSYGLPAVVHGDYNYHMPEIAAFKNGSTGISFLRNSPESLYRVLREFMYDLDSLNSMSSNSLSVVRQSYNSRDMAERLISAISEIIDLPILPS